MTTREDFEASADQWIRKLRHFYDSAAREVEQLDKLMKGRAILKSTSNVKKTRANGWRNLQRRSKPQCP